MGGNKSKRQQSAQDTSAAAMESERQRAAGLQADLSTRKTAIGVGLPETMQSTRTGAENLRATGGFNSSTLEPIRTGYSNMALTGGFAPGEREAFLRRASGETNAIYDRTKNELSRRMSVQGGYMPGFDSSSARLTRNAAQSGAEASLGANVELANQVRQGRTAGLAGQERIAGAEQQGRIAGQDALQRYTTSGVQALNDVDINELRNALQTGQMTQAHAQLLAGLAAQDKTLFDKVMQGVGAIGGAAAGVLTGVGSLGGSKPTT